MSQKHVSLQIGKTKQVGVPTLLTSYKRSCNVDFMIQHIMNPVEFDKTNQQMDLKNSESFGKAPKALTNALRKGTEKNNVLRNNRIKSEIEDTCDISISCLNRKILAITIMDILLFKN
ncbi:MAG: hypothetical protein KGZ37_09405 [Nitrosarchaeum sp.]|nr:hypothetical protein [Nitrosarchaeum sp.]